MKLAFRTSTLQIVVAGIIIYLHCDLFEAAVWSFSKFAFLGLIDGVVAVNLIKRLRNRPDHNVQERQTVIVLADRRVTLHPPISVRDLARALDIPPFQLVGELMDHDIFVTQESVLSSKDIEETVRKRGWTVERED